MMWEFWETERNRSLSAQSERIITDEEFLSWIGLSNLKFASYTAILIRNALARSCQIKPEIIAPEDSVIDLLRLKKHFSLFRYLSLGRDFNYLKLTSEIQEYLLKHASIPQLATKKAIEEYPFLSFDAFGTVNELTSAWALGVESIVMSNTLDSDSLKKPHPHITKIQTRVRLGDSSNEWKLEVCTDIDLKECDYSSILESLSAIVRLIESSCQSIPPSLISIGFFNANNNFQASRRVLSCQISSKDFINFKNATLSNTENQTYNTSLWVTWAYHPNQLKTYESFEDFLKHNKANPKSLYNRQRKAHQN